MKEYIDFNSFLQEIYQEAEKETIRLILESGLTEVILSNECDIPYASHNNECGLSEDAVTVVKVWKSGNGYKHIMFKCGENRDGYWESWHDVQESIIVEIYEAVYQTLTL